MAWWFFYTVLGVTSALECGICLHGGCLSPTPLRIGSKDIKASSSAIYFKDNVLYTVNDGLQAIHLDENTKTLIETLPNERPAFITVDQISGDVYYSYGKGLLYQHQPKSNETKVIRQSTSKYIWVYNGTLYTAGLSKGLSSFNGTAKKSVDTFKNTKVKDVIFDKFGNLYASTAGKVFKVKSNEAKTVLTSSPYGLRNDRNGDVYLIETNKHLVHQLDLVTNQLQLVGAFGAKYHDYIHSFKFDKYNNIIARFPNTRSFTYFKHTSDRCMIDPENTPYTHSLRIINLTTFTTQEDPKNVTTTDNPHFGA